MAQKKPGWLPENAYASPRGWVVKHQNGLEEVLHAARGLVSETVVEPVVEAPVVVTDPVEAEAPFSVYPPEEVVQLVEEAPKPAPAKIKLFKDKK